jgi:ABC-type multidrug transport system permease subunit
MSQGIISIVFSAYYITILWFGAALQGEYILTLVTFYITLQCGVTLAYAIGSVSPTMEAANALLPTYVTVGLFFIGFFITYDSMPIGWAWYSRIVHMRYAWSALMINHYEKLEIPFLDGKTVLQYYSLDDAGSAWTNVGYLLAFYIMFVFLAYLGQCKLSFVKR